ncbi:hypothetical protein [Microbacterium sp.]|uniref:hypothetical protein n=1 Tax=Microbacterium sp. TaxID=51671 RepID=UPI003C785301
MDDATLTELRALRARAYGPDADIDADPTARSRLRELEATARVSAAFAPASDPPPPIPRENNSAPRERVSPVPSSASRSLAEESLAEHAPAEEVVPVRERLTRAWRRRPVAIAWVCSLVAVAAVVAVATYAVAGIRPVSPATGAPQVATLDDRNLSDAAWLDGWWGGGVEGASAYAFHGVTVVHTPRGMFSDGTECLTIIPTDGVSEDGSSIDGPMYYGCAAGPFPAVAQLTIDENAPEELRDEFGEGTALQFVLDGDVVGVFAAQAKATPSATP